MKTGILLLGLGGPDAPEDVKPFLFKLFSDPAILVGLPGPLRKLLALLIASVKGGGSVENYRGSGSFGAQLRYTLEQAAGLRARLPGVPVAIGMAAWNPLIEEGLLDLRRAGVDRVLLFPLFPQYSTTTSGSCFDEVARVLGRWRWDPEVQVLRSWPAYPPYVQALRARVREAIARARIEMPGVEPHVLFSAHSLPMSIVKRGDPYPAETRATLDAVTREGIGAPYSLCFQSRNGKARWLEPYTEDEIERLGREGARNVVVVPISFVSDHVETLYELDQLYAELARECGIERFARARSLNADADFLDALASLAREAMERIPPGKRFYASAGQV